MTDIHQFVTRYSSAMDLRALSETDMANVLDSIRQLIRSEGQDRQHHLAALTAVKILSRARDWVDVRLKFFLSVFHETRQVNLVLCFFL